MELKQLVTYSFDRNVGTVDRVFRVGSGAALAGVGAFAHVPVGVAWALGVVGLVWALTGIVSRCGIYYLLGYSTCPISGNAPPSG